MENSSSSRGAAGRRTRLAMPALCGVHAAAVLVRSVRTQSWHDVLRDGRAERARIDRLENETLETGCPGERLRVVVARRIPGEREQRNSPPARMLAERARDLVPIHHGQVEIA